MSYASLCSQSNTLCSGFCQNLKEWVLVFSHWYLCKARYNNGILTRYAACSLLVSIKRSKKIISKLSQDEQSWKPKKQINKKQFYIKAKSWNPFLTSFVFSDFSCTQVHQRITSWWRCRSGHLLRNCWTFQRRTRSQTTLWGRRRETYPKGHVVQWNRSFAR